MNVNILSPSPELKDFSPRYDNIDINIGYESPCVHISPIVLKPTYKKCKASLNTILTELHKVLTANHINYTFLNHNTSFEIVIKSDSKLFGNRSFNLACTISIYIPIDAIIDEHTYLHFDSPNKILEYIVECNHLSGSLEKFMYMHLHIVDILKSLDNNH